MIRARQEALSLGDMVIYRFLRSVYVVGCFLKPAVLKKVDPQQFGTLPGLNTTYACINMLHKWNCDTDGNSATVRILLFDFKKAFDLIDHDILIQKLVSYKIPNNFVI
jgi:hypothetical protein